MTEASTAYVDLNKLGFEARARGDRATALVFFRRAAEANPTNLWSKKEVATELRELHRPDEAEAVYRSMLDQDPKFFHALYGLGFVARSRGDHEGALAFFQRGADLEPKNAWNKKEIAAELQALKRLDEADLVYQAILDENPLFFEALRGRAVIARSRGDHEAALAFFRQASEANPTDLWTQRDLAAELRELGQLDEAESAYRGILNKDASFVPALYGLAHVCRNRGDHEGALAFFQRTADAEPKNAWNKKEIATELHALKRLDEADLVYQAILDENPLFFEALRGRAVIARSRGDHEAALAFFRQAWDANPSDLWTQRDIAAELRDLGKLDEAESVYLDILNKQASFLAALNGLAQLCRMRGDREAALAWCRRAEMASPGDVGTQQWIATLLRELGRLDESETAYGAILAKNPASIHAIHGLAYIARAKGDHKLALSRFEQAAGIAPHDLWTRLGLAAELRELKRLAEAEALCCSILSGQEGLASAWIEFSRCARLRGDRVQALNYLQQAVRADPGHIAAKLALANEYRNAWRLGEAESLYDEILAVAARDYGALVGKGLLARHRGDKNAALAWFREAAAVDPGPPTAWLELATIFRESSDFPSARDAIQQSLLNAPDNYAALLSLGYVERCAGNWQKACDIFADVRTRFPNHVQPAIDQAAEEFRLGRPAVARELLHKTLAISLDHPSALDALAHHARAANDLEEALDLHRRNYSANPGHVWASLNAAKVLLALGRADEGLSLIDELETRTGLLPDMVIVRADILNQMGYRRSAAELLAEGERRFPDATQIVIERAILDLDLGLFDQAEHALSDTRSSNLAEKARIHSARGLLASRRWDFPTALYEHEQAAIHNPQDAGCFERAAIAAILTLDLDRAKRNLRQYAVLNTALNTLRNRSISWSQTYYGYLLNEFRLDQTGFLQLVQAQGETSPDLRLALLRNAVIKHPDYTPAALMLLIEMRRQGQFSGTTVHSEQLQPIPRKIAQFWDKPVLPRDLEALTESWRRENPDFSYRRFCDHEAYAFIANNCSKQTAAAFRRATEPAMRADLFRLAWLYERGGFYTDVDDRCTTPISTFKFGDCQLILYQEDLGSVGNNFIGAAPYHSVIGEALACATEAIARDDKDLLWLSTGPGLLSRCLARTFARNSDCGPQLHRILILERHQLSKAVAIHCMASYKHTHRNWFHAAFRSGGQRRRNETI